MKVKKIFIKFTTLITPEIKMTRVKKIWFKLV